MLQRFQRSAIGLTPRQSAKSAGHHWRVQRFKASPYAGQQSPRRSQLGFGMFCSHRLASPGKLSCMDDDEQENFERVEDLDNYDEWIPASWLSAPHLAILCWMGIIFVYPLVWAIGTATAIAMLSGYGTARGILKVKSKRLAIVIAPFIGVLWIAFFWALFVLFEN